MHLPPQTAPVIRETPAEQIARLTRERDEARDAARTILESSEIADDNAIAVAMWPWLGVNAMTRGAAPDIVSENAKLRRWQNLAAVAICRLCREVDELRAKYDAMRKARDGAIDDCHLRGIEINAEREAYSGMVGESARILLERDALRRELADIDEMARRNVRLAWRQEG